MSIDDLQRALANGGDAAKVTALLLLVPPLAALQSARVENKRRKLPA